MMRVGYVVEDDGCWIWTGRPDGAGYGRKVIGRGRSQMAHRYIYEQLVGPIPEGHEIDHLCRVRLCVNPEHLEPVTPEENKRRAIPMNRKKTHCVRGHLFSPENTYITTKGHRTCRECMRAHGRSFASKRRARAKAQGGGSR